MKNSPEITEKNISWFEVIEYWVKSNVKYVAISIKQNNKDHAKEIMFYWTSLINVLIK